MTVTKKECLPYEITAFHAIDLLTNNSKLWQAIKNRKFTYVPKNPDGKITEGVGYEVINDPKYIERKGQLTNPTLTQYAKEHMDECCLNFSHFLNKKMGSLEGCI